MGGKTVDPSKYISKPDPSRDIAFAMAAQQLQQQQMANAAQMLQQQAAMPVPQQTYDIAAQSQRAAQLGLQNIQKQKKLDRILNPEAAAFREAQSKQVEALTSPESVNQYMSEYMRTQGLPAQYATGLGDSTIGRAAAYDRALAAKRAYEENLAAQRMKYLAGKQAPVGGISPATSIAAQQAVEAQNLAAEEAKQNAILQSIGQFGQMGAQSAMQQFGNLARAQQAQQQSQQAYRQMQADYAAQQAAAQNKMLATGIGAAGGIARQGLDVLLGPAGIGGGGTGMTKEGFYRSPVEASSELQVPTSQLGYQPSTGLGGFLGLGKQGGYYLGG